MAVGQKLYEGKAKILYATDDPNILLTHFKDDATAFNAQKKGSITGKGEFNCAISTHLFKLMEANGVPTHFIDRPSANEMRVKSVKILPLEVVVRNIAAGNLCQQTGLKLGTILTPPLVEFYYKNDELGDPLLTFDRLQLLDLATPDQVDQLIEMASRINEILTNFFQQCGITLVDFKLEFGCVSSGVAQTEGSPRQIILADEISPDTCRLWNQAESDPDKRVMDKDRFRRDLGNVEDAYRQVMERVLNQTV
ncbi:phosphoribosylaminoimidazolesuccinocarboxamide synthase [Myxacorys almedinensis]|uniref:Phosphoribosylaminoimidazole-succinocarboxamide synthase n=1 Tax=Myxacorys almedinensis A TaxID=2690445 RepID=A0A8J7YYI4_9CYAN|nr:phosphoribosylaminoimidazolesuccinocarboxamide synthase [Myxacorys almedinensis]NDJ15730.1 phosphoribosylaminoimidazolesuccinocarboxamide synthase [Myxacorys almedinensis A]